MSASAEATTGRNRRRHGRSPARGHQDGRDPDRRPLTVAVRSDSAVPAGAGALTVLLIEHRGADARLVKAALEDHPEQHFHVAVERSLTAALDHLAASTPDAIVLDVDLPGGGVEAIEAIRASAPALPLIVLSAEGNGQSGVRAMDAGAQDYFIKGELNHTATLGRVVLQALARQRLRLELAERLDKVENSHIRLRNIVDLNLDAILVVDRGGRVLFANRQAEAFLEGSGAGPLAQYLAHPRREADGAVLTLTDAEDRPRTVHLRMYPTGWDDEEAYLVLLREPIGGENADAARPVVGPDLDAVTGLFNRAGFSRQGHDILQSAGRKRTCAAMVCLNLERFRRVNQALGYGAGDALLRRVADRLRRELRAGDLIGCFGRDEFLILLTSLRRPQDAAFVAGKLLEVVALPIEHRHGELRIKARAGVSLFPRDGRDISELIGHAQIAAERAKHRQPERIAFYTSELASQSARRFRLEQDLQKALGKDQFSLVYQPIMDVRSDRPIAAEALLRWRPEPGDVVTAGEFVPILEEIGLIDEVGEWVIRNACIDARNLQETGCPLPVSVNLSPLQFASEGLPDRIRDALADSGLPPQHLWLEVTESALMQPLQMSIETLDNLRKMGISVCIDDFGTGFSSLAYLKRFPIDTLKIDQSFVRDLVSGPKDAAITRNTVQLAHALGLNVVAEGVETPGQLERLREYHCDFYQGHLFSTPLPARELRELVSRHKRGQKAL